METIIDMSYKWRDERFVRENITPWGDGNLQWYLLILSLAASSIRENITPWGDGNLPVKDNAWDNPISRI